MSDIYRIYRLTVEQDATRDGGRVERGHGCNGEDHAVRLDRVFCDAEGEVVFAKHLTVVGQGPCDNTCGEESRGRFLYPCPTRPIPAV